jgi:hypothetical protein
LFSNPILLKRLDYWNRRLLLVGGTNWTRVIPLRGDRAAARQNEVGLAGSRRRPDARPLEEMGVDPGGLRSPQIPFQIFEQRV